MSNIVENEKSYHFWQITQFNVDQMIANADHFLEIQGFQKESKAHG